MLSILDKALQAILKMLKKKDERVLLWSNASPTSTYGEQEISVDTTKFREVKVLAQFHPAGGTDNVQYADVVELTTPVGYAGDIKMFSHTYGSNTEAVYVWTRFVKVLTNKITFDQCWVRITNHATYASTQNTYLVPLKIYGIKSSGGGKLVSLLRNIITKGGVRYA